MAERGDMVAPQEPPSKAIKRGGWMAKTIRLSQALLTNDMGEAKLVASSYVDGMWRARGIHLVSAVLQENYGVGKSLAMKYQVE